MSMAVVGIMRGGMRAVGCGTLVCASLPASLNVYFSRVSFAQRASERRRARPFLGRLNVLLHRSVWPSFISLKERGEAVRTTGRTQQWMMHRSPRSHAARARSRRCAGRLARNTHERLRHQLSGVNEHQRPSPVSGMGRGTVRRVRAAQRSNQKAPPLHVHVNVHVSCPR